MRRLAAGFNSSTQSFSGVCIDPAAKAIVSRHSVKFGDPPLVDKYGLAHGYMFDGFGLAIAPPALWTEALDLFMPQFGAAVAAALGVPKNEGLKNLEAASGAGQQHGSVYMTREAAAILASLDPAKPMVDQLRAIFSRPVSPIWRDDSTDKQCDQFARRFGGRSEVAKRTGSPPTRRFTGPQILKFAQIYPVEFTQTGHVALVSSFICSLFLGKIAPIDHGDGAGMNLMDINTGDWCADAVSSMLPHWPNLRPLLPNLVPSTQVLGPISPYFVQRHGFSGECQVLAFTGDNPASMLGNGVYLPGQAMVISLGTSDTIFCPTELYHDPSYCGCVFGGVTGGRQAITVFKNGSLARERRCNRYNMDWSGFEDALRNTPPGNSGMMIVDLPDPEITPTTSEPIEQYFGGLTPENAAACIRALVEMQVINMWARSAWMGPRPKEIRATGGASVSRGILQVIADVFDCPVRIMDIADSVSLGAAMNAAHSMGYDWDYLCDAFCGPSGEVLPQNPQAYTRMRAEHPVTKLQ